MCSIESAWGCGISELHTAVQIGAGNIGRGFIAQLFSETGFEVVFIDISTDLIDAFNSRGRYEIEIVGPGACRVEVAPVRGVLASDTDAAAEELARCHIASVSVGANALKHVAPLLAKALVRRGSRPLDVLICENLHDAASVLREAVRQGLGSENQHRSDRLHCVQAVVGRMVPLQAAADHGGDPLGIRVEAYKRLPVDGDAVSSEFPAIPFVEPYSPFIAQIDRKLYSHNGGHAALGYAGWLVGYDLASDAMADPQIAKRVRDFMDATSEALIRKHGFAPEEQRAAAQDLQERFGNRALGDTCFRIARDPVRKLAHDDRLVGAARLCEECSVDPAPVAEVIGMALCFADERDPSSVELAERIRMDGLESTIEQVSRVTPDEPLGLAIRLAYHRTKSLVDARNAAP